MSMNMIRKLPTPKEIKELYPLSDKIVETKKQRDKEIADVFTGKSNKFLALLTRKSLSLTIFQGWYPFRSR